MSSVYLIRHGQAGTRQRYDALSEKGRAQARLLGRYLAGEKIRFRAAVSGSLIRQRETAEETARACREAGWEFPPISVDAGWNEFDLDAVWREVAPAIAAENPVFREQYAELMRQAGDANHGVHHTWSRCDVEAVQAWIEGRYPVTCETWEQVIARIRGQISTLPDAPGGEAVAVFTSAVPIGIVVASVLGVEDSRIMRFAAVLRNAAVTTLRQHAGELGLFSFNGIPHLTDPELRTYR